MPGAAQWVGGGRVTPAVRSHDHPYQYRFLVYGGSRPPSAQRSRARLREGWRCSTMARLPRIERILCSAPSSSVSRPRRARLTHQLALPRRFRRLPPARRDSGISAILSSRLAERHRGSRRADPAPCSGHSDEPRRAGLLCPLLTSDGRVGHTLSMLTCLPRRATHRQTSPGKNSPPSRLCPSAYTSALSCCTPYWTDRSLLSPLIQSRLHSYAVSVRRAMRYCLPAVLQIPPRDVAPLPSTHRRFPRERAARRWTCACSAHAATSWLLPEPMKTRAHHQKRSRRGSHPRANSRNPLVRIGEQGRYSTV